MAQWVTSGDISSLDFCLNQDDQKAVSSYFFGLGLKTQPDYNALGNPMNVGCPL